MSLQHVDGRESTIKPPDALQSAFASSITTGIFPDTAYHLYSRRAADSKFGSPRIVYGSSTVLKAAGGYFAARESSVTDDPNTQLTRFNVHKNCLDGSIPINV